MDINLFIKHVYRILPIYENCRINRDYSNYIQTIDYSIEEMSIYKENKVINKIIECLAELKEYHDYNHYNVRKIVFYCLKKLEILKNTKVE